MGQISGEIAQMVELIIHLLSQLSWVRFPEFPTYFGLCEYLLLPARLSSPTVHSAKCTCKRTWELMSSCECTQRSMDANKVWNTLSLILTEVTNKFTMKNIDTFYGKFWCEISHWTSGDYYIAIVHMRNPFYNDDLQTKLLVKIHIISQKI